MTSETRKMLDERLLEIEAEQKDTGKCCGERVCTHGRMFLYTLQFVFEKGKKGSQYGPTLPLANCCILAAHRYVFSEMWDVAEASLGFKMTGACIRFDQELFKDTFEKVLGL